jgi:hypothetical protein
MNWFQSWLIGMAKNYLVKNWRTSAAAAVAYACYKIPQVNTFLTTHGYDIQGIQAAALLVIGILAKDGSVTGVAPAPSTPAPGTPGVPVGDSPGGFARLKLLIVLVAVGIATLAFARSARADDAPPQTGILSVNGSTFSAHANVAVGAVGYSFTQKAWLAAVPITGLYALCYKPWKEVCGALGGSFSVGDDSKPRGALDVALLSPAVANPFQPAGSGGFRVGLDFRSTFGPTHEQALLAILPFQF